MSFSEMMQEAINIRTSTDAKLRVDFDARPQFQQASMFVGEEVRAARSLPLDERLAECTAMKLRGNEEICRNRLDTAIHIYEQALAIFWYLDNRNPNWKTGGIKDEDIEEVNFCPNSGLEALKEQTRDLKVALLLNMARAYSARSDYVTSVKACSAALAVNPSSAKGLYLRGKAKIAPASAGAFEIEEAMRDVLRAGELAPGDSLIRSFMNRLRAEKAKQKEVDKATFAGMFGRGRVCGPESSSKTCEPRAPTHGDGIVERGVHHRKGGDGGHDTAGGNPHDEPEPIFVRGKEGADSKCSVAANAGPLSSHRHVEESLVFLNDKARECEEEGREEWADCYRQRVAEIEKVLQKHDSDKRDLTASHGRGRPKMDWRSPSETMRQKAAHDEWDLNNVAVISFLSKMQEKHEKMRSVKEGGSEDGDDDDCSEDGWTREVWEGAILCMTRNEVETLLNEDLGVDPVPADASLGDLRNLAAKEVLTRQFPNPSTGGRSSGIASSDQERPKSHKASWKISAAITLVLFTFKFFQMGLWRWLIPGEGGGATAAVGPPRSSSETGTGTGGLGWGRRTAGWGGRSRAGRREQPYPSTPYDEGIAPAKGAKSSLGAQALNTAPQAGSAEMCYDPVEGAYESVEGEETCTEDTTVQDELHCSADQLPHGRGGQHWTQPRRRQL